MLKHSMLHIRTQSSKSGFLLPYCFTTRIVLMVSPVGMNSEYSTPLKTQTIVGTIFDSRYRSLEYFGPRDLLWPNPIDYFLFGMMHLSLMMILLRNSPVSHSRCGRNCWQTPICFHCISVVAVVTTILRASVGSQIGSHCRQSFASDAHFVRYSLMRKKAVFLFASTKPFRWALSVALRGFLLRC
jgi:hypothetical protein